MRRIAPVATALSILGLICPVAAADAPFGFSWSQGADAMPKPSSTANDSNYTVLTYQGAQLPKSATQTEVVTAKVCDGVGLQQVRWYSHPYALSLAINAFLDVYQQGVQRYGEAQQADLEHGAANWTAERIRMRTERDDDSYRILVISDGPQFAACRAQHRKLTGR